MKRLYKKCEYYRKNNKKDEFDDCTYLPSKYYWKDTGEYGGTCYYQVFQEECDYFKLKFTALMEDAIRRK